MDLNKVMIIGRLTRDPEMRATTTGINVCSLSVATNYVYTNQQTGQKVEQVEYHNIVLWRKLAEIANQYLKKGTQVFIEGRLQTRSWDAQDGQKRYKTEIVADNMIMLARAMGQGGAPSMGSSPSNSGGFSKNPQGSDIGHQIPPAEELPTINADEGVNVEDIPF